MPLPSGLVHTFFAQNPYKMSTKKLFSEFAPVSSKQWKQQIQFELKGADYNETLIWESPDGIKVKPFYHADETKNSMTPSKFTPGFKILQKIFVHDVKKSNLKALDTLERGAESIYFTLESENCNINELMQNLPLDKITYYFNLPFLSISICDQINEFALKNKANCILLLDPIGQLVKDGNWFKNKNDDFDTLNILASKETNGFININTQTYQNAGATCVQQMAYALAHANEYFNGILNLNQPLTIEVAIGTNYFFEIAKLRALRILFTTLAKEYNHPFDCHIIATPSKRNKTLYDYNVNMLRTTSECMAAICGGADAVANLAYDAIYHKDNEFGDRISRNQLLILKNESYFDKVSNPADGAYYIETLTEELAEKALELFKDIEANGGLITQLIEGTIQRKINESAQKEQTLFDTGKEVLIGTNKYPNQNDKMKQELELFPFVKQNARKTLITPIIEKRLAEKVEQERLAQEQ